MGDKAQTSRTVLIIGSALVAGGLSDGTASAQSASEKPAVAPGFPTCVVKAPTDCRLPDGHPNLTGLWANSNPGYGGGGGVPDSGLEFQNFAGRAGAFNFETDGALFRESNINTGDPSKPGWPIYKPEFWDQITDNNYNGNFLDPLQRCMPDVIPRVGAPSAIVAVPGQPFVQLLYADTRSFGIKTRIIPTDGRPRTGDSNDGEGYA